MHKIDKDKLLHFFWGSVLLALLMNFIGSPYGIILFIIVNALKELIWDGAMKKGNMELLDFIYGSLPIVYYYIYKFIV